MKTGLVITGSGLNGAFACGVLKPWIIDGVEFPLIVGSGFGALCGAYYRARQWDGLDAMYDRYFKEYAGGLRSAGVLWGEDVAVNGAALFESAKDVDMDAFRAASGSLLAATTRADNGDGVFWRLDRISEEKMLTEFLRATASDPGHAAPVSLIEHSYFNGRFAEPLPISEALAQGCDRLVVVHTKGANDLATRKRLAPAQSMALKDYPALRNVMLMSHLRYNDELRLLHKLEQSGQALVVAPLVNRTSYKRSGVTAKAVTEYYSEGLRHGESVLRRVKAFLEANH